MNLVVYLKPMKKIFFLIATIAFTAFINIELIMGQTQSGCTLNFPNNYNVTRNFSTVFNMASCPSGDVIFNNVNSNPGGDGVLIFNSDVTLNSLTINFANGNKPTEFIIPAGVTVNITNNLVFVGQGDKDKFFTIEGTLNVGGTIDFGDVQFEIDGSGNVTADRVQGASDTTCSTQSGGTGTCPTFVLNSCDDGGATSGFCSESSVLPIELKSFNVDLLENSVYLQWVTAKEENFSHFEVERRFGKGDYETIGFVQGMGESLSDVNYDFTDYDLSYGETFYRLKAIDIDGQFEYSPIKVVQISLNGQTSVYPNPARSIDNVKITLPRTLDGTIARVALYDLNGAMLEEKFDFDANESLSFNKALKQGMYILKIQHNGTEDNVRVMIQ